MALEAVLRRFACFASQLNHDQHLKPPLNLLHGHEVQLLHLQAVAAAIAAAVNPKASCSKVVHAEGLHLPHLPPLQQSCLAKYCLHEGHVVQAKGLLRCEGSAEMPGLAAVSERAVGWHHLQCCSRMQPEWGRMARSSD